MREVDRVREREPDQRSGGGEEAAGEWESRRRRSHWRSPMERGATPWKRFEPKQLKNKRKRHTAPPSNSSKSARGKKLFDGRSTMLLSTDDVEPSMQTIERPPSSEHEQLKNKRKRHTMTVLNSSKSARGNFFFDDRSTMLLSTDDVEPSMQTFERPPSKRGSESEQLKNKRKRHTLPPSNSSKNARGKVFFDDRSTMLFSTDDVEPSMLTFERSPSMGGSEPEQLKNKRKRHTMPTSNSLKSERGKEFDDISTMLPSTDDVEPSMKISERHPIKRGSESEQLKNKRKRRTMPPSNSSKNARGKVFFDDRSTMLLSTDDVEPSMQTFVRSPSKGGSEPEQLKTKRKRHSMPISNSLKSARGKQFDGRSTMLLSTDDVEPSMQSFERHPSKRGAGPRQLEKERKIKKRRFLFAKPDKVNNFVNFDSSVVPFPGNSTGTSIQASNTAHIKREMALGMLKESRRTRRRTKAKSSIRESDLDAPVHVVQHHLTSLDRNRKSSSLSTSGPNKEVYSVLDNKKISQRRHGRRSRKRGKDSCSSRQYTECSSLQLQGDIDSSHSSVIQTRKRRKNSENVDDISLSVAKILMTLADNGFNSSTKAVLNDSNYYIPSDVNLDTPDRSNIKLCRKKSRMTNKQNTEVLNTEVRENHYAKISALCGSFSNEDEVATGDLALKNVASLDLALVEMDSLPVSPERALRSTSRKKLLVLDLNGILCDVVFGSHASFMPYKKVNQRSVFRRPFLDDFLTFCFEKFAVGVWSSRNERNVAGVIDYIMGYSKDKLLFCWDQSKCTVTGFKTIEDRHKPLLLKELIKLWNKEDANLPWEKGVYSPANTLLVDDSPYKSLCNPPNTAIFPFPFDYRDVKDNSLGPGGDLRVYLERIAAADDVQEHVKQQSFGQHAITSEDKMWSFYERIIHKNNSMALTG